MPAASASPIAASDEPAATSGRACMKPASTSGVSMRRPHPLLNDLHDPVHRALGRPLVVLARHVPPVDVPPVIAQHLLKLVAQAPFLRQPIHRHSTKWLKPGVTP